MATKRVRVGSKVGIHARPSTIIAELASRYHDEILVELVDSVDPDSEPADASSSLMLMALGAQYGDEVYVSSTNATAVDSISQLIAAELSGLGDLRTDTV